ncbi:DNA-deoxyinosine glycosylase [Flavobacterium sp. 3HN19-14]|uniref:DNA-deoxyinosine glycosylase n=1 Tax=Flavobacterium sp. 3HN19-14 TaxID=3448133 RepID=UPI003EE07F94
MISSFPPFVNEDSEILILGTMPGATSLAKQEYYGFNQNAFWKIIYSVFAELPVAATFDEKKEVLKQNKIAVWDVLENCERKGSLDIHIKNHKENDFDTFFSEYPKIRKILFNGKESHKYFFRKYGQIEGLEYHVMPSTSPANTMTFEKKLEAWKMALI